jgi:histidine triad (HIT) family protein
MEDCIFCKIIRGDIPSDRVLEDDHLVAIRDINPRAPVHILVIPKEHVESLHDLDGWEPSRSHGLLSFTAQVAEAMGVKESGYRVVSNTGPDAGQEVDHLHLHVLGGHPLRGFW